MEKVATTDAEFFTHPMENTPGGYRVSEALGTTDFSMNYYELEPGERFSGGIHTHNDQEEVFFVLSGTATFDTEAGEATVTLGENETIRFAPGELQTGYNATDDVVRGLALGAPKHSEEVVAPLECPMCGEVAELDISISDDRETQVVTCPACGGELEQTADE